jgi:hypothetical protein
MGTHNLLLVPLALLPLKMPPLAQPLALAVLPENWVRL